MKVKNTNKIEMHMSGVEPLTLGSWGDQPSLLLDQVLICDNKRAKQIK